MVSLALRNVLRHRFRTMTTLASVTVGVVAIILVGGFVRDIYVQLGEAIIHSQTGHLQVARPGFFGSGSRFTERQMLDNVDPLRAAAATLPETAEVMARLSFTGLLNNGKSDLSIVGQGVEPDREQRFGTRTSIINGRQLAASDRYSTLVGEGVAQALKLKPGDRIVLLANTPEGALNTLDLEVVGVFRTFSREFDARAIRIPLATAQELLATRGVNTLVIGLHRTEDTEAVAAALKQRLVGNDVAIRTWQELDDFYPKTVELYRRQFGVLQLVVLVMVLLSVANTVNMSVFERMAEFGTMRALGNTGEQIFGRVVLENAVIGAAGALLGALLAVGLALGISAIGIPMPPPPNSNMGYDAQIRLVFPVIAGAIALGVMAALLASLLPAWRAARQHIADALREAI